MLLLLPLTHSLLFSSLRFHHTVVNPSRSLCSPLPILGRTADDVQWNAQGRNKAIVFGQVGIRCRHCSRLPSWSRSRGAVYYSATLDGLYQAAQNMAKNHLCRHCRLVPEETRQKLISLRDYKRRAAGGKRYWAEGAGVLGVVQCEDGLRFENRALLNVPKARSGTTKLN